MPLLSRPKHLQHQHLRPGHTSSSQWFAKVLVLVVAAVLFNILLLWPLLHNHVYGDLSSGSSSPHQPLAFLHSRAHHVTRDNFLKAFDANADGVLDEAEFSGLVQEACAVDRQGLSLWQRLQRLLGTVLLQPLSPCHGPRELLDAVEALGLSEGRSMDAAAADEWSEQELAESAAKVSPEEAAAAPIDREGGRNLLEGCAPLSKPLLEAAAKQGTVMIALADWAMFDVFGVNFLTHVQRAGIEYYLIAALDQKTANFLTANKLGHCGLWNPAGSSRSAAAAAGSTGSTAMQVQVPAQAGLYQRGSAAHKAVSWARLEVAELVLSSGLDVLLTDLDTVWFKDPLPYLQQQQQLAAAADMVVASQAPATANKAGDLGLEGEPGRVVAAGRLSLAVVYARPSGGSLAAIRLLLQQRTSSSTTAAAAGTPPPPAAAGGAVQDPQAAFHVWANGSSSGSSESAAAGDTADDRNIPVLRIPVAVGANGANPSSSSSSRGKGEPGLVRLGVWSLRVVGNGYSHFVSTQHFEDPAAAGGAGAAVAADGRGEAYLAVHMGWGGSTKQVRLHNMRDAMWYADGPKYYSDPRLLSFELQHYTPPKGFNPAVATQEALLQLHLQALTFQLSQTYAAAALAVFLDRALVLPPLECYCWSAGGSSSGAEGHGLPVDCRAKGDSSSSSSNAGAFNCTLEQVFRPEVLYAHLPIIGRHRLTFRERSFLANPRLPSWIPHSKTEVAPGKPKCGKGTAGELCVEVSNRRPPRGTNQQVLVPESLTDIQLLQLLAPFATAKWLHLKNVQAMFKGFADPQHKAQFDAWWQGVVRPWCCKQDGGQEVPYVSRPQLLRV